VAQLEDSDQEIIRKIKDDLGDWNLRWLVGWPTAGLPRRRTAPTGPGAAGTTATPGSSAAPAASRYCACPAGRYHAISGYLRVKEVRVPQVRQGASPTRP
jgi:hypothetical protein